MAQIVYTHIRKTRMFPYPPPGIGRARQMTAGLPARDHPGIPLAPFDRIQHMPNCGRQRHMAQIRLAVAQAKLTGTTVHIVPPERQYLVPAAARQQQHPGQYL